MRTKFVLFFAATALIFLAFPAYAAEEIDSDGDGLSDVIEAGLGADPLNPDTDGDSYPDGLEAQRGYNPLKGKGDRSLPRHVTVNLSNQTMDFYLNNVKLGSMPVSTGRPNVPSPTGEFKIIRKLPVHTYTGLYRNFPNTKWNLEFKRSYYIHSAYWHNDFGKKAVSGGCVNLPLKDAEKMYSFLQVGDKVVISGKTPRGVLAKK